MLSELHIENLGVIERAELVVGPGMTALTGETGAGKTMLVEAIELVVGGRADASIVRPGSSEARVDARFVDGETEHVLTRVVPADGRSRAYIDGRLATVASLAELGRRLVDLHGQHAHQSLLTTSTQRDALDRFGGIDLSPLREARARLTELDAELATLGGDERSRARETDLLRYQVDELHAAGLDAPDEEAGLDTLESLLADAVAHRQAAAEALAALVDDGGARDGIGEAVSRLGGRAPFEPFTVRLRDLAAELDDLTSELRATAEGIEEDPHRLEEVRARRQLLRDLCRKYGDTLGDVLEFRAGAEQRLAELEHFDVRAAELDRQRREAATVERQAAAAVGAARREAAPRLAAAVEEHLRRLAMPNATVAVEVGPTPDAAESDDVSDTTDAGDAGDTSGTADSSDPGDAVRFLLSANPGAPLLPLAKVASGGELARAMLALRLVLTATADAGTTGGATVVGGGPATLVFDEVDAGIGGAAAISVGRALGALGARYQVFVVTHLAQVAACATTQVLIDKQVSGEVTTASATVVAGDQRVGELARMLSGRPESDSARRHALELLDGR